jgi:hypothetical protein
MIFIAYIKRTQGISIWLITGRVKKVSLHFSCNEAIGSYTAQNE